MPKIAVIGPGAMGCLFAAHLAEGGIDTYLIDYRPDRLHRLESNGIRIQSSDGEFQAHPRCVSSVPRDTDLAIVLTKAFSTKKLRVPAKVQVLTLQNGLGNVETLCSAAGSSLVLAGATSEAATLLGEGHVRHAAKGFTRFGAWTTCPTRAAEEALEAAGFQYEITDAPGQTLWEKAAINAAINPLTAMLNVENGFLLQIPEIRQLMRDLVVEAVKVAAIEGYRFNYSLVEKAEAVCTETATNISSMLQDVRAGKKTEIDEISGEIMRRATSASLPTPRTRAVWQLVKGLEVRSKKAMSNEQ